MEPITVLGANLVGGRLIWLRCLLAVAHGPGGLGTTATYVSLLQLWRRLGKNPIDYDLL